MMRVTLIFRRCRFRPRLARLVRALALAVGAPVVMPAVSTFAGDAGACLVVSAENIVTGSGNWYLYVEISAAPYTFEKGDHLEYDILLPALNPALNGGVDADLEGGADVTPAAPCLRDCEIRDQNGIRLHGNRTLKPACDQWYHRSFDLSALAGCSAQRWNVTFEGDKPGRYVQFLDNIRITRDGKPVFTIYQDGPVPEFKIRLNNGYSREVLITTAPREGVMTDKAVAEILAGARVENEMRAARDHFHAELDVARGLLGMRGALPGELDAAAAEEDAAAFEAKNPARYAESLRRSRQKLTRFQPELARFTGHLVGHAHIDLQWLWNWDETVNEIIPQTFGQAVKFMQEFPGFTFSQSSAALYLATEQHHPELFKQIQHYEKNGQWELVGGRWCEGDMNMISPESHVRHFLYAQRYFQRKFGHICTEGWEPDTFGHPWTMPQILRKSGIRSYYFCRAGEDTPLFWWEGPDGSRVLAFEEPPCGGWYIDVVSDEQVRELTKFATTTGARDHLMVYGVGNHGGGPTRENIEAALAMRDRKPWPRIEFSTLTEFFRRIYEQVDRLTIPTVRDELNSVFEGCYTSHSRIKRYNRDSESLLESAEVFASLASLQGESYPRQTFESLWRDVLWNHHHDTLCGSCVHPSALFSAPMYQAVLERGTEILRRSQRQLADRVGFEGDGPQVIVFNPLAWRRTEVVEAALTLPATAQGVTLTDEAGTVPTQLLSRTVEGGVATIRACFLARSVPGCGFKAFRVQPQTASASPEKSQPSGALSVAAIEPRFQILHEKPRDMSAWEVGEIDRTIDLDKVVSVETIEDGALRRRVRAVYEYDKSTITQDTISYPGSRRVDFETTVEWAQLGNARDGCDMLKVAFPTGIQAETATYEIPFGDVARKNDGHENVALKWCDLSGATGGVVIANDCKHAYDVKDGVIRLTLLRSSYDPDPEPDVGRHFMRYAAIPHQGKLDKPAAARAAWEFNKPLQVLTLEPRSTAGVSPSDGLPTAWSGCTVEPSNVIMTGMKQAEDNDDLIIRAYECAGKTANAKLALGFDAESITETDLLERETSDAGPATVSGRTIIADFKPYEIRTFRVRR